MKRKYTNTQEICMIGVVTSAIVIMAQISIPMPLGVPFTLQSFAITLAGIILGARHGALASLIYVLLGAIGLPVFSNMTGGYQSLIGPTGGFIISFPLMAYIIGLSTRHYYKKKLLYILELLLGTALNFLCGMLHFAVVTGSNLLVAFTAAVLPFLPATVLKLILASILGWSIKKRMPK